eukprot:1157822-Pelagomonas_calceolata.AAC.27
MQIHWFSGKLEWSAGGLLSPKNRPTLGPRPGKGTHISMLMKLVSDGAVTGAWLEAIGQLLSAARQNSVSWESAHCTGRPSKFGIPD